MKKYKLRIDESALADIQEITAWYDMQSPGLGSRFQKQAKAQINTLKSNPHSYRVRYADIRCMMIKKFPFLVHFALDETDLVVEIYAVIHTSRNPKIWEQKTKR